MENKNTFSWVKEQMTRSISISIMIYVITQTSISNAYPIFAQQGYENPREATGRIVCANCHLASKPLYLKQAPTLWCDNLGATYLSMNPVFHARTKHIEVDYHFVRERVARKALDIRFISTHDQLADVLTKSLATPLFIKFRDNLNMGLPRSDCGRVLNS